VSAITSAVAAGLALPAIAKGADQPHMRAALDALRLAKRELNQATADKGGHRVRAEKLVEQAIAEVERGIKYDNRH
jgi:hypothetical protein